jgi:hypothetical protein
MLANFVQESATAPGTATTINLTGAATGRRRFRDAFAGGARVYYVMDDGAQAEWGVGTVTHGTPDQLARTTVIGNTLGTLARLNFAGVVSVYSAQLAERQGWELIRRQTVASPVAAVDFGLDAGYAEYRIRFRRVRLATNNASLWLRGSINGGSSFLAGTEYAWASTYPNSTAAAVGANSNAQAQAVISGSAANADSGLSIAGVYDLDVGTGSLRATLHGRSVLFDGTVMLPWQGGASITAGAALNAIRLLASSGTITVGDFTLEGLRA